MHRDLIVIEKAGDNFSAYLPDLPFCVAIGEDPDEVRKNMKEAIELYIEGLAADDLSIPESQAMAEYIAVA